MRKKNKKKIIFIIDLHMSNFLLIFAPSWGEIQQMMVNVGYYFCKPT